MTGILLYDIHFVVHCKINIIILELLIFSQVTVSVESQSRENSSLLNSPPSLRETSPIPTPLMVILFFGISIIYYKFQP